MGGNREAYTFDRNVVEKAYAGWAPIYDMVFGAVFAPGRAAAVRAAEAIGGRVLDVGVGTGLSLDQYSPRNRVIGIDLSEPMLRRATARMQRRPLPHVEMLAVMNAERLAFADDSFDVVVAQYVITAVPDPEAALDEFARVVKPGGEIVLVNHLGAEGGLRRAYERRFAPLVRHLGWRMEFPFARLANWANGAGYRLVERREVRPFGHFCLMRFRRAAN
ncbi:MAG: class I SAM-dependent methyltransferase [Bradyrhizobiaceae bacterium]|nr:class I SAM-dependent methyltransferase [Bradyrhizobiaceae bacterium]